MYFYVSYFLYVCIFGSFNLCVYVFSRCIHTYNCLVYMVSKLPCISGEQALCVVGGNSWAFSRECLAFCKHLTPKEIVLLVQQWLCLLFSSNMCDEAMKFIHKQRQGLRHTTESRYRHRCRCWGYFRLSSLWEH